MYNRQLKYAHNNLTYIFIEAEAEPLRIRGVLLREAAAAHPGGSPCPRDARSPRSSGNETDK
jgi:hypothetical protein